MKVPELRTEVKGEGFRLAWRSTNERRSNSCHSCRRRDFGSQRRCVDQARTAPASLVFAVRGAGSVRIGSVGQSRKRELRTSLRRLYRGVLCRFSDTRGCDVRRGFAVANTGWRHAHRRGRIRAFDLSGTLGSPGNALEPEKCEAQDDPEEKSPASTVLSVMASWVHLCLRCPPGATRRLMVFADRYRDG